MDMEEFEQIATAEFAAVPQEWRARMSNIALFVAQAPTMEERKEMGLTKPGETLLGLYRGIPATERGVYYGVDGALPDTITLYRVPILAEAAERGVEVRSVIRETLWHEIAHHFGFDEGDIEAREADGSNKFL